ncbi:MAG: SPL family radical SAM protein [Patescibacteria group bacterium]
MKIREIQAKSILNPSKLGCDYAINPYNGCAFGCAYCYAIFMSRQGHQNENWGEWVDIKINAPALLIRDLRYKKPGSIFFSSVTDPYQGLETKYQLTRKCLEILANARYQAPISILTKSPLVTRDIDLFKKLDGEVGLTVTSMGDPITRLLETHAPPHQARIRALKDLHQAGIKTYTFVGPLLPHLAEKPKELEKLFKTLKQAGVEDIWVEHINLSPYIKKRLYLFILKNLPKELKKFKMAEEPKYQEKLDKLLNQVLSKIKFKTKKIIRHP